MPRANTDQPVTLSQFSVVMRGAPPARAAAWHAAFVPDMLSEQIAPYDIRQAAFLASAANETGGLRLLDEADLSYINTPYARVIAVFGHSAPSQVDFEAWRMLGRPQFDINFLNWVYDDAHRGPGYGLGNTHPGDGWRYRGMGPGATTGLGNFRMLARLTGLPLVEDPELVKTPEAGAKICAVQWHVNGCNELVQDGSQAGFLNAMRRLNAGLHDFSHHLAFWEVAKAALANDDPGQPPEPLPFDARRRQVSALQEALIKAGFDTKGIDGISGPNTRAAVLAFQKAKGLTVDGIVGPRTLAALGLA